MAGLVSFSSSIQTPAVTAIATSFNISITLSTFGGSSAYLLGFGSGPFLFAPVSEMYGRNAVYYITFLVFALMQLGCALSPNIGAIAVFRFIAGFCGGPVVANAGGSIVDLWPPSQRSASLAIYTVACYCGPILGPLIGGILTSYANWHWNFWLLLICSSAIYLLVLFKLPETYRSSTPTPTSNNYERSMIRRKTCHELARPWKMLGTEPILLTLSTVMAFTYGVLFLDFSAYPIVFVSHREWSLAESGLAFLGVGFGMIIATALSPLLDHQYGKVLSSSTNENGKLEPEARLRHLIVITWLLPVSLFWFAWTALPPVHWIVPILSGVPFGFSLVMLFLGINTYLTDCYGKFSASALAANTMLRSLFGAVFALFADTMFKTLGISWATSVLGFIAFALAPMPLLLYKFGPWLRRKSRFHIEART